MHQLVIKALIKIQQRLMDMLTIRARYQKLNFIDFLKIMELKAL